MREGGGGEGDDERGRRAKVLWAAGMMGCRYERGGKTFRAEGQGCRCESGAETLRAAVGCQCERAAQRCYGRG